MAAPPIIFDSNARRLRRESVTGKSPGLFARLMLDDLVERLAELDLHPSRALLLGAEPLLANALRNKAVDVLDIAPRRAAALGGRTADPADLDLENAHYDLIVSSGVLDTIDDLPGLLIQLRRGLRSGGRLLANFAGSPLLPRLRAAIARTDAEDDRAVARLHPQIDVRAAGDLTQRAGFVLPVADATTQNLAYRDVRTLIADLRTSGMTNVLRERQAVGRQWLSRLAVAYDEGTTPEQFSWITISGHAP